MKTCVHDFQPVFLEKFSECLLCSIHDGEKLGCLNILVVKKREVIRFMIYLKLKTDRLY